MCIRAWLNTKCEAAVALSSPGLIDDGLEKAVFKGMLSAVGGP